MDTPRKTGFFYTPLIKKALKLAFSAHHTQSDKSGMPYIFHPFHLAEQMDTEPEICTALLHDVVEDSPLTLSDLQKAGFPQEVLSALRLLTHADGVPYMEYIAALRENPIARKVKLADLAHNGDLARLDAPTLRDMRRKRKYRIAETILAEDPFLPEPGLYCKTFDLTPHCALSVLYARRVPEGYLLKYGEQENTLTPSEGEALRQALNGTLSLPEALLSYLDHHTIGELDTLLHTITGR